MRRVLKHMRHAYTHTLHVYYTCISALKGTVCVWDTCLGLVYSPHWSSYSSSPFLYLLWQVLWLLNYRQFFLSLDSCTTAISQSLANSMEVVAHCTVSPTAASSTPPKTTKWNSNSQSAHLKDSNNNFSTHTHTHTHKTLQCMAMLKNQASTYVTCDFHLHYLVGDTIHVVTSQSISNAIIPVDGAESGKYTFCTTVQWHDMYIHTCTSNNEPPSASVYNCTLSINMLLQCQMGEGFKELFKYSYLRAKEGYVFCQTPSGQHLTKSWV